MNVDPRKLHELLTYCIDFANAMLNDAGEFFPFGAVANPDGDVRAAGGFDGEEHPDPQEIYELLAESFTASAQTKKISAAALAAKVNIPAEYGSPAPDALRVHLECEGYSRFIFVPYVLERKGVFRKSIEAQFLEPFSVEIGATFFGKPVQG
jgi:hypothetical protein